MNLPKKGGVQTHMKGQGIKAGKNGVAPKSPVKTGMPKSKGTK